MHTNYEVTASASVSNISESLYPCARKSTFHVAESRWFTSPCCRLVFEAEASVFTEDAVLRVVAMFVRRCLYIFHIKLCTIYPN